MNSQNYAAKLRSPKWQRVRLAIFERDNWTCQSCGDEDRTLHVHHTRYVFGLDPWDYDEGSLISLCESCHQTVTDVKKNIRGIIDNHYITPNELEILEQIVWNIRGLDERGLARVKNAIRDNSTHPDKDRSPNTDRLLF